MLKIFKATEKELLEIVAFQLAMALETENLLLNEQTVLKGVTKIIENSQLGAYYVAMENDKVLGCLLTLFEWSDWRNASVIWIHSVYVQPASRKKGIFKSFFEYLSNIVNSDKNFAGLRLYVDKSNISAQKVYEKMGMNKNHYELYEWLKSS